MDNHTTPRVVVTGLGLVTPLGLDVATSWRNMVNGVSGAGPLTRFDASGYAVRIAAEVKDFNPEAYPDVMEKKEAKRWDRAIQFTVVAAAEALKHSGLQIDDGNADEIGVLVGTGIGGLNAVNEAADTLHAKGPMRVSPFTSTNMLP
ncbi:MAG: beta-ketoacyl synthase N-terminal-like domain-containing protein, partial [Chloroflexota bacterium]